MAVPTSYVFTSGTCAKSQIYQLILDSLTAAGWTNVSSLATSDFVVMRSTGNTGDKNLILNLRDTNAAAANSIVTTDYCAMSFRLQDTYTPGAVGVAGTFGRSALAWTALYIAPVSALTVAIGKDTIATYHVYADASKLILCIEYPNPTNYGPTVIYMGEPDTLFAAESASRGTLVACSCQAITATGLQVCNTPDTVASVTAPYNLTVSALLPLGDPNTSNKRMVSSMYYGSATESFRGKLDGVKCAYFNNLITGDTVTIGEETYYVVVTASQGNTSFPTRALLLRIA